VVDSQAIIRVGEVRRDGWIGEPVEVIMVTLTYRDLLQLIGLAPSDRHSLEILGYECSSRGLRQFRRERPDVFPQVYRLIEESLEETGTFPRNARPDEALLVRQPDGRISLFYSAEISMARSIWAHRDFGSVREAIIETIRLYFDRAYVTVPPSD
jgi:hypothetical protein